MSGTVTGTVDEGVLVALGGPQRWRALAAAGLAVAAGVAAVAAGSGLALLLPTLVAALVLAGAAVLVPADRAQTTTHRFRVTEVTGRVVDCVLTGTLSGAPLRAGDGVEVFGRVDGAVVRAEEVVRGGDRLRGRSAPAFHIARHAPTAALALAVAGAVGAAVVVIIG